MWLAIDLKLMMQLPKYFTAAYTGATFSDTLALSPSHCNAATSTRRSQLGVRLGRILVSALVRFAPTSRLQATVPRKICPE